MDTKARAVEMGQLIDTNQALWEAVHALMLKKFGRINLKGFATLCGISIATVQRIQAQETSVGINVIDKIAATFDLAAWQLLVPGFDPSNPPALQPVSRRERMLYEKLMTAAKEIAAEPQQDYDTD